MAEASQNPQTVHQLMRALNDADSDLTDIEGLIRADQAAGRIPSAEADMDIQNARDAHLRECRRLREEYAQGEPGTSDDTPRSES